MYKEPMFKDFIFKGKTIWITGGGTGLGKSMATYFASLGANIVINGRRMEILESTAKEIQEETGASILPIQCDVRNYEEVEDLISRSWEKFGAIDVLINNAAGNFVSPTERLSNRAFDAVVDIVLKGSYNCSLAMGKKWIKKTHRGNMLNITTTYAWTGSAYVVPSACAKAGVLSLTRSLAIEWAKHKIRVNAIAPGPFPTTGAWTRLFPEEFSKLFDPKDEVPLKRFGEHQELSNLAAYLISDFAAYVTGEVVTIDGGEWLQDAGQFNNMRNVPEQVWDELEKKLKDKK